MGRKSIKTKNFNTIISDAEIEKAMKAQAIVEMNIHDFDEIISNDFGINDFNKQTEIKDAFQAWIDTLNFIRRMYIDTKDNRYWRLFWDLCPVSYVYDT